MALVRAARAAGSQYQVTPKTLWILAFVHGARDLGAFWERHQPI
jgi:hypothetical protein